MSARYRIEDIDYAKGELKLSAQAPGYPPSGGIAGQIGAKPPTEPTMVQQLQERRAGLLIELRDVEQALEALLSRQ